MEYFSDYLQDRLAAMDAFIEDLINCEKVILHLDTQDGNVWDFYVFLLSCKPAIVRNYLNDVLNQDGGLSASVNWDNVEVVTIPFDTDGDTSLMKYFLQSYSDKHKRLSFVMPPLLIYSTLVSGNARDIWNLYGEIHGFYYNIGKNKDKKRISVTQADVDSSAWSESNWPEIEGLATRYIDNVGVYLPDNLDVDFNLSHTLGRNLVACSIIRPSNSTLEAKQFDNNTWNTIIDFFMGGAGHIPNKGAAGPAQGIINTVNLFRGQIERAYQAVRVIYPRLRAFGRQTDPIPTYAQYEAAIKPKFWNFSTMNKAGDVILVDMNAYHTYKKIVVKLTSKQFSNFVDPLKKYISVGVK